MLASIGVKAYNRRKQLNERDTFMKRDSIKTAVGLAVIAGIVVATFLYGNTQRQAQLRHDQDLKNQLAKAAAATPTPTHLASTPAPTKPAATPIAKLAATDGATASNTVIPDTGPSANDLIGLAAITLAGVLWRGSNARVRQAVRVRG
jgi:hypothetical protein